MSDLKIHRDHNLGLEKARRLAQTWASQAEKKMEMSCTLVSSESAHTVQFSRAGVTGDMVFTANTIDLNAKLGFLIRPFVGKIEAEANRLLDASLAKEAARQG